jgi:hypothetical protein
VSPTQLPLAARSHQNQQLFSDHYLDVVLPERSDWKALEPQAEQKRLEVAHILDEYRPSENEAQTERYVVRKVLEVLGHTFEVQASLWTSAGTQTPDYVFYRSVETLNANKDKILIDALVQADCPANSGNRFCLGPSPLEANKAMQGACGPQSPRKIAVREDGYAAPRPDMLHRGRLSHWSNTERVCSWVKILKK